MPCLSNKTSYYILAFLFITSLCLYITFSTFQLFTLDRLYDTDLHLDRLYDTDLLTLPTTPTFTHPHLHPEILDLPQHSANHLWTSLLKEASHALSTHPDSPILAMEIGMHSPNQCFEASQQGLTVHCLEPSPQSYQRVENAYKKLDADVQSRTHIYNLAAGSSSNLTIPFYASGGTGDHIGDVDMWKMQKGNVNEELPAWKQEGRVDVLSIQLDDLMESQHLESIFVMKIDTQGYEPSVFQGLYNNLAHHTIQHILFEFWPKGMDLIATTYTSETKTKCQVGIELMSTLLHYGYTLYPLDVVSHPKRPQAVEALIKNHRETRPLSTVWDHCLWYLELEEQVESGEYQMGYWTDVLAVSPKAWGGDGQVEIEAMTDVGKVLQREIVGKKRQLLRNTSV